MKLHQENAGKYICANKQCIPNYEGGVKATGSGGLT